MQTMSARHLYTSREREREITLLKVKDGLLLGFKKKVILDITFYN